MSQVGMGRPIVARVFLEGIEVPLLSAQVTLQKNAPAQCVLQLPPSELGTELHPRTLVHLFFLDSLETAASVIQYRGDSIKGRETRPSLYELSQQRNKENPLSKEEWEREERNRRYKLLFVGEAMGFAYSKSLTQRSLVLQCLDLSNYWDYAYQFNNTDLFGPGIKAVLSGGATNLFTDFLSSPGEITTALLHLPSANYPALKGVMGGMIRMIESIGGAYQTETKFEGQNTFFALAELRLHIAQMLTAYPDDPTVTRLLGSGGIDSIFGRTLGDLGEQVSIRTVFNAIAGMLFLETFPVSTPLFVPGSNNNVKGRNPRQITSLPQFAYITSLASQLDLLCDEMTRAIEGTPAGKDGKETLREKQLVLRRFTYVQQQLGRVRNQAQQDKQLRSTQNKRVKVLLQQVVQQFAIAASRTQQRWTPGTQKGPQTRPITEAIGRAQDLLNELLKLEMDMSDAKTRTPQRLNTAIVRPDVWFSAPPRCNVLFPHHILNQSYQRNWMQEPTRLLLKVHDEFSGEDELFDSYFFAPRARTAKGKRHKGTLKELFDREIMHHELFTGILPLFTTMGEFNILALRGADEWKKKPKDRPKISLAQRTANFLYFQRRFAARNMSVSAIFSPWIAPGFPGLIFDRYVDPADVEQYLSRAKSNHVNTDKSKLLGKHFLGNFTQITHQISWQSAETSIQVEYPRAYDESVEYLGPSVSADQVVVKRYGSDGVRNYTVAALEAPKVGGIGLYYGSIQSVSEVTDAVQGMVFSVYTGPRRVGDTSEDGSAQIGPQVTLGSVSPTLAARLGDKTVTFRAFRVKEAIPRYRRDKVDLPAEEAIRPGWYADIWSPSQIGRAYQHFFQTGSITDATQVADPGSESVQGDRTKDARDRLAEEATGKTVGDPTSGAAPALLSLDQDSSIQQATEFLLAVWSYIQQGGLSVQRFTDAYGWRPIASIPDVFGTSDLQLDERGINVVRGVEGIHSRAFGPYEDLFGLVTPEVESVLGAKKTSQMRREADIRGIRYEAVLDYRESVRQVLKGKGNAGG